MNWISNYVRPRINSIFSRREVPENLWAKCDKCGEIQLKTLIEEKVLYSKPHNAALGETWRLHNHKFVEFL